MQGDLALQHFNAGKLKTLLVAQPEPNEQSTIVERIEDRDSDIAVETAERFKPTLLKFDLLTGRVRVPA